MICWGEQNCCGVFLDRDKNDRCNCLRDFCIRDYAPEDRITVSEKDLDKAINALYDKQDFNMVYTSEIIAIKSILSNPKYVNETKQLIDRLSQRLTELEFDVEVVTVQPHGNAKTPHYVIFANYFSTPAKNVVLVYGRVTVKDVKKRDWTHYPFQLTQTNQDLFGNGLTSTKGPVLCWIFAAQAWLDAMHDLPVNLRFIIDTFDTDYNQMLRKVIDDRKVFFKGVDLLITTTNLWITSTTPLLTTSHSGYIYFELEVKENAKKECPEEPELAESSKKPTRQPMAEMCLLMNTLTDPTSKLMIDLNRHVLPVTHRDWDILSKAEMGIMEFKNQYDVKRLLHEESQASFLKHRWCMPDLSMHKVEYRSYAGMREFYTPSRVVSKFSVKLVPDQSLDYVTFLVRDHLEDAYKRLKCEHPAYLRITDSLKPINEARHAPFNLSAKRAYERIFAVEAAIPDTMCTCIPMLNELRKYCMSNAQVMGMPFCSVHMQGGQINEGFTREHFFKNLELFVTMLFEVALVPPECKCTEIKDFCFENGKTVYRDFIRMMHPRERQVSDVLFELDEAEIDKAPGHRRDYPSITEMLLGKRSAQAAKR
ncbi:cytosolic non-specific dipeptidase [Drosophila mojavensis]|uniref:Uncharacterized protein n=1 Tax=Drosophila mojavensis TaxID=7230 RepID=B4KEV4_DROMO|nr:cytosolic non-specific dipeptidase [Drosophila mojavensis]EDW13004.1 uncharacterized protein Dmoj_GI21920 [Drosophila mojavensis]